MDLRYLKTFICVAEQSSFTRAAKLLGYSQSTVSFQIKQLEEELQTVLFDRVGHNIALTRSGREVLAYAHRLDTLSHDLTMQLQHQDKPAGLIRLATADSLMQAFFGRRYIRFREAYPDIRIKVYTAGTEELFNLLNHNEADLLMTLDTHIFNSEYVIAHEEPISVHFVTAAGSPAAERGSMTLKELSEQTLLLTEKGMSYRRIFDEALAKASLEIEPVFESGDVRVLCHMVCSGLGICLLPDFVTEKDVAEGRLVRLKISDLEIEIWRQLIYHRNKWISPELRAVIEYCK